MSYSHLATDETATSPQLTHGSAFPPGYEDLESGNVFQNYIHLSTKNNLITTLNVDTDLPPVFGRFADEEEQKNAKNVLLRASFINATVRLQGSAKAKIEMRGESLHRRVLQIVKSQQGAQTQFAVEVFDQGRNAIVVVPEDFSGTIAGHVTLSPMLSRRSTCLVQDEQDVNKTRYTVAPLPGIKGGTSVLENDSLLSSVSNTFDKPRVGQLAEKCYVCLADEYLLENSEAVNKQGEKAVRLENAFWPARFCDHWVRLFTYGTTGDKVALSLLAGFAFFMLSFFALIFYAVSMEP